MLNQLFEYAGGWLGWTEEQTLHCDMNYIVQAYRGRTKMFRAVIEAVFGPSKEKTVPATAKSVTGESMKLSPKIFDTLFDAPRPRILSDEPLEESDLK